MAISVYLFETKAIQSYLSRSGKLKDVVMISDALAELIDTTEASEIYKVITSLEETSNILNSGTSSVTFNFFRCKGGTFYCYCEDQEKLKKLRQYWTFLFQQKFPYMSFSDALVVKNDSENFSEFLTRAMHKLTISFNTPILSIPYATTLIQTTPQTGYCAVAENKDLTTDRINLAQKFNVNYILYKKFLKKVENYEKVSKDFYDYFFKSVDRDEDKNVAVIHLDGNGIGQLLRNIKNNALKNCANFNEYSKVMRDFSNILGEVTEKAAQNSFKTIYERHYQSNDDGSKNPFLFRPLVLGGDDLTIIIEAQYAVDFSIEYCKNFKNLSKEKIKNPEINSYLDGSNISFITTSGGILFNKENHPYSVSSSLVEQLADALAKSKTKKYSFDNKLTKNIKKESVGASAISIFRMNVSTNDNIKNIIEEQRAFNINATGNSKIISTGDTAYYTNNDDDQENYNHNEMSLEHLMNNFIRNFVDSKIHARFRKMLTEIAKGDFNEACKIYNGIEKRKKRNIDNFFNDFFGNNKNLIHPKDINNNDIPWCVEDNDNNDDNNINNNNKLITILDDINVLYGSINNFR